MGALVRAFIIAGNAALGWLLGDIVNEVSTTQQANATASVAEAASTAGKVVKRKWHWWLIGALALGVVVWLILLLIKVIREK